jgi:hypothetical protein
MRPRIQSPVPSEGNRKRERERHSKDIGREKKLFTNSILNPTREGFQNMEA